MRLRLVLAEDHEMVRQGFRALLQQEGMSVIGEAADGFEAIRLVEALRPDVAVLDYSMPGCNGLAAAQAIRRKCPRTPTLILTMHDDEHRVVGALREGIRGYVLKTQAAEDLVHAIRHVASGGRYLSPCASREVVEAFVSGLEPPDRVLTPRDRQMLQLVAEGNTTKKSATLLNVSIKTADSYRAKLMGKLGIHTTPGLVRYAIRERVVDA